MSDDKLGVWHGKRVLVTGGASFIGSHLVDVLVALGASVCVVDDLSTGKLSYLSSLIERGLITFTRADLRDLECARLAARGTEVVFHLAANHGGRGYISSYPASCSTNLALDSVMLQAVRSEGAAKVVFASSACVYPDTRQSAVMRRALRESDVGPPYDPDCAYGWAKLSMELALKAYRKEAGLKSVSCRYFTVYGPRCSESHALVAMIARAFVRANPFDIWGDGKQIRSWTHVDDVVRGTILAAERIDDASAVNLGSEQGITVLDAAKAVCACFGYRPVFRMRRELPTGPSYRVASSKRARDLLNWKPQYSFLEGLERTIRWYVSARTRQEARFVVDSRLMERL